MKKDTPYFPHDFHARTDPRILKLRMEMKWEGYGIYWAIVEKLHESGGSIKEDIECIAFELQTECDRITKVLQDFALFRVSKGSITCDRVMHNLTERELKSQKARDSAGHRWGKDSDAMRSHNDRNADDMLRKERKGKEKKEKREEKTTHSRTPSGAAGDVALPPEPEKDQSTTIPHWHQVLDHMRQAWQEMKYRKTGRRPTLYIQPKWLPALKSLMAIYPAHQTLALWDVYLTSTKQIAVESGHGIPQFLALVSDLVDVDGGRYKSLSQKYQDALEGSEVPVPKLQVLSL